MVSISERELKRRAVAGRIVSAAAVLLLLAGCATKTPEEKIEAIRARYVAELNGFFVRQQPVAPAIDDEGGEAVEEEEVAAEETALAEGEPGELPAADSAEAVPLVQNATLDILLRHDSFEKLPGITIDILMQSADGQEKGRWTMWADTANLEKGNHAQFTYVIEDAPYVEGDGFFVEVRSPIPADERGDYPEFAAGG